MRCQSGGQAGQVSSRLPLSAVATAMPRSGIRDVMDAAWSLERRLGPDDRLIHLEVGQPDFSPPETVLAATAAALRRRENQGYIPNAGLSDLRTAVANYHQIRDFRVPCRSALDASNVVVCHGAVGAVAAVLQAVLEPGDEILLPDPGWVNYSMAAQIIGGVPVPYPLSPSKGWKPDPRDVAARCTPKTKAIVLCTPSNPTGGVLTQNELTKLVDVANAHDLLVISDEIYSQIYFGDETDAVTGKIRTESVSVLECCNHDPERTVVVSGVSKAWAMTGFRVGWLVTRNDELASTTAKLLEASISCGVPFAQAGALAALTCATAPAEVAKMVQAYRSRRDAAVAVLASYGMDEYVPHGAFYLMVRTGDLGMGDTVALCKGLLEAEHVAVSPGVAFGEVSAGYVRVSLASSITDIEEGVHRLCRYVSTKR
eukprot:SAG31_NODE_1557_length_7884_cov_69.027357_4_plen_428_part_00